ncbi:MAG: TonB-dependent receptor [Rhizobiales bacterium]|nr:TonB-dependent receptor [Hyphomicrobiales bacterium]
MVRRSGESTNRNGRHKALVTALLLGTATVGFVGGISQRAIAQSSTKTAFSIPAGPLNRALAIFGRQSGLQITYNPAIAANKRTNGATGQMDHAQAIGQILQGSGLSYSFPNAKTVTIAGRATDAASQGVPIDASGSTLLNTITVTGGQDISPTDAPYRTAAPTSYISKENIDHFRGSSPADIFRGTPGVMSGDARNGGAVDVNIRGMQGFGRVATTVDGAENGVTVYQGYQGLSNRTYIDPDFIGGVEITKGSNVASRGIAGNVAIRTINADDIIKPGNSWGIRIKGEYGGNSATPHAGAKGGYQWPYWPSADPVAIPSKDGMGRPSLFTPTSGSGSVVAAIKDENYDFLAGYAYRKRGNYYAGKHGPAADHVNLGPKNICNTYGYCQYWPNYIDNGGLTNYRAGEEVLNTQSLSESYLAKATLRFDGGHTLQLGYTGYRGEAGDLLASRFTGDRGQPTQQEQTSGTRLDTGTMRYSWKPDDNDLIDLKANLWLTQLEMRNVRRGSPMPTPGSIGLPAKYRTGSDTIMYGGDVSNTSKFDLDRFGSVDFTYGLSYLNEDTRPSGYTDFLEGWLNLRNAYRQEAGAYGKVAYKPVDWLTINGGLRYSHYWSHDRSHSAISQQELNSKPDRNSGGVSPSVGVTVEPFDGAQLYANYSDALRYPSLFESVSAFTIIPNPDLKPERSSNWEIGVNYTHDDLLSDDDRGMVKFGYFNWDVKDYIARAFRDFQNPDGSTWSGMQVYNIDRAKFSGLEFSSRYESNGFTADLTANYYLGIQYCRTDETCGSKSLYGDYGTNFVPPKYSVDLTVSQKMLDDRLTVGGRVSYIGPRAIGHGDVTATGAAQFIALTRWKPYALIDVYADYKITDALTATARIENLTDKYYVDPLGLVNQPGPGRTFYLGLTSDFGGDQKLPRLSPFSRSRGELPGVDWTGFYAGIHAGMISGRTWGVTTALDGTADPVSASESADHTFGNTAMFGLQAGYNYQFNNRWVVCIEADVSKTRMRGAQVSLNDKSWLAPASDAMGIQAVTHYDIDWTGSVRGRLGYALNGKWLVYGTAGLAFLHEKELRDQYHYAENYYGGESSTGLLYIDQDSSLRAGLTIGAGAEYAINDRWSIKVDYAYSRYGNRDFKFDNGRAGTGGNYTTSEQIGTNTIPPDQFFCSQYGVLCDPSEVPVYQTTEHQGKSNVVNGRRASSSLDTHAFKLGLNYHF